MKINKLDYVVAIVLSIELTIGTLFVSTNGGHGGGGDGYWFFARSYFGGTTIPAWAYFILTPFSFVPYHLAWLIFTGLTLSGVILLAHEYNTPKTLAVISASAIGVVLLGQIEFLMLWAWLLILWNLHRSNPYINGIAIFMLSIKPQTGWLVILWLIWQSIRHRSLIRTTIVPVVLAGLSFVVYGWWVSDWLAVAKTVGYGGFNLFPWSLGFLVLVFNPFKEKYKVALYFALSLLTSPYIQLYHGLGLVAIMPILSPISWLVFLAMFFLHHPAFGIIIPLLPILAYAPIIFIHWKSQGVFRASLSIQRALRNGLAYYLSLW